jgi:hypothetical protein
MSSAIHSSELVASTDCAFQRGLSLDQLHNVVPAAFAEHAFVKTSPQYVFISTAQLVAALMDAGFQPTRARQANARGERSGYAKHMIRFRHARESVTLVDAVPEVVLINAHDGTSAYQLRAGLFRPVCTNGLMTRMGDFGLIHVPHRGDIVANVVDGALEITRGFAGMGEVIERMARTELDDTQRRRFAEGALRIRYRDGQHVPFDAARLLEARRPDDIGRDVWRTYNCVQENIMKGGISGRSGAGRSTRTRAIRAVREDVRINVALWQLAANLIG